MISNCTDYKGRTIKNHCWIRDSYSVLKRQLKYLTKRSIQRNMQWLREHDYIFVSSKSNPKDAPGVNWYSVNYKKINQLYLNSKYTPNIDHGGKEQTEYGSESTSAVIREMKKQFLIMKEQNQKLRKALQKSQSGTDPVDVDIVPRYIDGASTGISTGCRQNGDATSRSPIDDMSRPSNKSNKNNYKTNYQNPNRRKSQIADKVHNQPVFDKSFSNVSDGYTDTFGSELTAKGLNRIARWLSEWDAPLIVITFHLTNIYLGPSAKEAQRLGYAYKILMGYRNQGIVTASQWHKDRQRKEARRSKRSYRNSNGGTSRDMRNLSFYKQMCQVASTHRTGEKVFPPVNDIDKRNGKLLAMACRVLIQTGQKSSTVDINFDTLADNNYAKAREILETENRTHV